ncbi:MAG: BatA domain-containing protein [Candidatus Cloacimonetes bacterium]|jgi:hypothetical protein|nr:BatA domain-containing protein [Candidatus Cloacimonadota bacterium]MDD2505829.1 BatA domain-containing protein [Candidatus Cloacimonadota bacterium]MDD4148018.1 BatA domain-containing protein [Candidatus Cloacimonadota bacterium]MDD4559458.1 BatA domain-containing protein [Candidatus Cloacimonadota bacterium]
MFELSFLNAGLLYFAAATVLPLLIWLLAKKKPHRIIFSSLRFIKESREHEKKRSKITNIILLILRMLIILLLCLAIARPMLVSSALKDSDKHPPTALAIVLDNSYSMDYVEDRLSRLDLAIRAIERINAKASPEDRLILVTRDEAFNALHAQIYAKEIPPESLKSISWSHEPMDWPQTLAFAESRLEEAQMPNREIYLISDLVNENIEYKSSIPLVLIPVSEKEPRQNLSLSDARVLPQIVDRAKQQTIEFTLTNHGSAPRDEVLVQAVVNDIKVGERFVSLAARQSMKESISFELRDTGWQSGYIEVMDEYLSADNRSYFAFEHYPNPRIAVVGDAGLPPQLRSILRVFSGSDPIRIDPSAINLQMLDDYQLLLFYPFETLSPRHKELFAEMDRRGMGSLICPGPRLGRDTKTWLEKRFNLKLGDFVSGPASIDFVSPHHQASALIADKNLRFSQVSSHWQASSAASPLISASSKALAVTNANSALWLWDLAADSPFFSDPAFAVYAYRQLSSLMNADVPVTELKVGDLIRANALELPDASRIDLANPLFKASDPGIYTQNPDSPRAAKLAVNISYLDSDTIPGKVPKNFTLLGEDFEDKLFMSRLGKDLWKSLLILAGILMLTEIALIKYLEYKSLKQGLQNDIGKNR